MGSLEEYPLAVKLLENWLCIYERSTYRYIRLNALNILHVPRPCFIPTLYCPQLFNIPLFWRYLVVNHPCHRIWLHNLVKSTSPGRCPRTDTFYEYYTESIWSSSFEAGSEVGGRSSCCWSSRQCRCCTCSRRYVPSTGRSTLHSCSRVGWQPGFSEPGHSWEIAHWQLGR